VDRRLHLQQISSKLLGQVAVPGQASPACGEEHLPSQQQLAQTITSQIWQFYDF
jgi:hypothetical protein